MIKRINKVISNILDEQGNIVETQELETILLFPEEGKGIRNKTTGYVLSKGYVGLGTDDSEDNYEDCEIQSEENIVIDD